MIIGVPKEVKPDEYRVGLVPSSVRVLSRAGHTVLVERSAGAASGFDDDLYAAEGAEMADSAEKLWGRSEMVIKVKEPVGGEYRFFREGLVVYAFFHLAAEKLLTRELLERKVTAVAYETIQEPDGSLPILIPMSEIAGRMSVQAGATYLERPRGGSGLLLGGVPGTGRGLVTIIGGGAAGSNAARMALGLGARVRILNRSLARLRQLDDVFGGAVETVHSTHETIAASVRESDLVIGSVLIPGARAPRLVSREMVAGMKRGSVIVDVSVDQGGCVETTRPTTHHDPVFTAEGVTHYCVTNIPGAVPRTSTNALTNASFSYALEIADKGLERAARESAPIKKGVNAHSGKLTHRGVADSLGMEYSPFEP